MTIRDDHPAGAWATRLEKEGEELRAALKPFADAVFNDNGDMTITHPPIDAYAKAYFVWRRLGR